MHSAFTSAMMTAARKAPVTEPMPPTTTTTKASLMTTRSSPRLAGSRATCSAPPKPARKAPSTNTTVNSMAWLTPSAPTISRSCVAERTDDDQEKVVARKVAPENFDRAAQARSARPEQVFGSPHVLRRVVDDQDQREGGEQLEQLRRLIDAAQQQHLDQRPERRHQHTGGGDAAPEAERAAHLGGESRGEIEPQHVERAVGDIDDAGDAENERQPGAHEKQARRRGEPVERLKEEGLKSHETRSREAPMIGGSAICVLAIWIAAAPSCGTAVAYCA